MFSASAAIDSERFNGSRDLTLFLLQFLLLVTAKKLESNFWIEIKLSDVSCCFFYINIYIRKVHCSINYKALL